MLYSNRLKNPALPLLSAGLFLVIAFFMLRPAYAVEEAARLTKMEGQVDVLRNGDKKASSAILNTALHVGDIVRTKDDGKAEITFIDNSMMSLGPRSRLGIEAFLFKPEEDKRNVSVKLHRGKAGFRIEKRKNTEGSKFEMKTRTAVAGVRGTEGILLNTDSEKVFVREGLVSFENRFGSLLVQSGMVGEVSGDRRPGGRNFTRAEYNTIRSTVFSRASAESGEQGKNVAPATDPQNRQTEGEKSDSNGRETSPDDPDRGENPERFGEPVPEDEPVLHEDGSIDTVTPDPTSEPPIVPPITDIPVTDILDSGRTDVRINLNFP